MKCIVRFCLFLILSLLQYDLFAQDSTLTKYVSLYNPLDTNSYSSVELDNFQNYRFNYKPFLATSGNIGLPTYPLNKVLLQKYNGFFQAYSNSIMNIDDLKFFSQEKDVTTLKYTNGANSEQYFNVFHSNQFGRGLNLSFDYNRIISEGFYINQLTDNTHFNTTLGYKSNNSNYRLKIAYLISNIKTQENGGLLFSDSLDVSNSSLIPTRLTSATHKLRSQTALINQSLLLSDSTFLQDIRIYHQSDISWSWKWYKDLGGQEFYNKFYIDSALTFDSIHYSKFTNSFGASILNELIRFDYSYEYHDYHQSISFDTLYSSQFLSATLAEKFGKFSVSAFLKLSVAGYNSNDFEQHLILNFIPDTNNNFSFSFQNTRLTPYYWQNRYYGNHVFYSADFDPQYQSLSSILYRNSRFKFKFGMDYESNRNLITYTSDGEPIQVDQSINRLLLYLGKDFTFGKFRFNNDINYQYIDNQAFLPLPSIFTSHSLYFVDSFFKNKLLTQIGSDLRFINSFNGFGYFPESSVFTLQEERDLGNFVYLDLFLKFRIQHVRVFAKMENLFGNQLKPDGMLINGYGIPGRVFKIGVSWTMFN